MINRIYLFTQLLVMASLPLCAQVIQPESSLAVTNAVEIGRDAAIEKLKTPTDDLKRHLIFDAKAGSFKGVIIEAKAGQMFTFDTNGLLNLILKVDAKDNINVFDTHGKWLYVVRNGRHLFDAKGKMRAVLSGNKDNIVMTRISTPKKPAPVEEEAKKPIKEQE